MNGFLPYIATQAIALTVQAGVPVTVSHGIGRQVQGWLIIWQTTPIQLSVVDPEADTANEIRLTPDASGSIKLVLL